MENSLVWNVYNTTINTSQLEIYNIFRHNDFYKSLYELKQKKDITPETVRQQLISYFCSKSEYEIVIIPWRGSKENMPILVDVYQQVMLNFDKFYVYLLENLKELKEPK